MKRISGEAKDAIERIRSAVNLGIEAGKIKVGRQINANQLAERLLLGQPTFGIFSLAKGCDAVILDDRCLNQHANFGDSDALTPIFSTLDLIDALVATGSKMVEERLEYRTLLRRAGYIFLPVSQDELALSSQSLYGCGRCKVVETVGLKAIRENILQVRMSTWLQIPEEEYWLVELQRTFVQVLKGQWKAGADFSFARARSNWIHGSN